MRHNIADDAAMAALGRERAIYIEASKLRARLRDTSTSAQSASPVQLAVFATVLRGLAVEFDALASIAKTLDGDDAVVQA